MIMWLYKIIIRLIFRQKNRIKQPGVFVICAIWTSKRKKRLYSEACESHWLFNEEDWGRMYKSLVVQKCFFLKKGGGHGGYFVEL